MSARDSISTLLDRRRPLRFAIALGLLPAALACTVDPWPADSSAEPRFMSIVVQPESTFQTMTGWEATINARPTFALSQALSDSLIARAVDDVGINRLRVEVRSGAENARDYWSEMGEKDDNPAWRCVRYATVNDNDDPSVIDTAGFHFSELDDEVRRVVIPMQRALAARGERLIINLNYVAFTDQLCAGGEWHHGDPEEYAEFMLAASLHLRDRWRITPDYWEVILEPDNTPFWHGREIALAMLATARRLSEAGFTPRFIAPSDMSMSEAVVDVDAMLAVPGVEPLLAELSYHRYAGASDETLRALGERARRLGIPSGMLEHIGSGYQNLYRDIAIGGAGAWQQYVLAGISEEWPPRDRGFVYVHARDPGRDTARTPEVRLSESAGFLKQYFRYVREGATRIGASGTSDAVTPLAFRNRDGSQVVVLKLDRERGARASIVGLSPGRYGVTYATSTTPRGNFPDVELTNGAALNVGLSGRGVVTVFARANIAKADSSVSAR
ncbi:MAG TPA: hypothetical protein VFG84_03130 [Gemmatimonadaceae bacterium]|nr:hypothetical protein [Gemmatimonadaceae bacterium]